MTEAAYKRYIARNLKFNSVLYIVEGFAGAIWSGLAVTYLLLFVNWNWAQFRNISIEGVSSDMLGYFQAVVSVGFLASLFLMTVFSEDLPKKKQAVLWIGGGKRVTVFLFALATWLFSAKIRFLAVIFISIMFYICGSDVLPWRVMYAKVIPIENRGIVEAWRNILARIGGFAGLIIAIQIFNPGNTGFFNNLVRYWPGLTEIDQARYFLFFLFLSIFGFISLILVAATREPREDCRNSDWKQQLHNKISQFKQIIAVDHNFRRFQLFMILSTFADVMMFGYAALFVRKYLGLGEAVWGELNIITMLIGMNAMFRWGKLGDEFGWKKVTLQLSVYIIIAPLIFVLLAYLNLHNLNVWLGQISTVYGSTVTHTKGLTMLLLCLAFALWGFFKNSILMAKTYFTLEFHQGKLQTSYYGITTITQQAATAIAALVVGLSIDHLGIPGVITLGIILQIVSAVYCWRLDEPRAGRAGRNDA